MRQVQRLRETDVLRIGVLPADIVGLWTEHVADNQEIVLTGKQRAHYLERHPEMVGWEEFLAETVLDPDRAHRNRRDLQIALFYRQVEGGHYLRATVVIQPTPSEFKHSIITYRVARRGEVKQNHHREVWRKR